MISHGASQIVLVVKNLPANAGDIRDAGFSPEYRRSPGGGQGNPLQYCSVENPMDRGSPVGYSPWDHKELDTTEIYILHV